MALAERRGMIVLRVSFSLLILRQAASVTTPPVQECETKVIVCERQSTEINCENGHINICTAVYGRTDSTTCPHQAVSDTSCGVDVVAVLGPDCNGRSQCRIRATNSLAGDPCGGTHKYLEVAYTCKDFDECAAGTHSCAANASCQNAPGSFICVCQFGYIGNGFSCTDIDECTSRPATCNTNAICTNTPGSFKCTCNPGYRGDGSTCTDVNECKAGIDNYCYANSACTNTPGSFTCICNEGYTFNGTGCIVDPLTTITTIVPPQPTSAGRLGAVIPTVVVLIVVILTAVIVAVICYRRRRFSSTKDQGPHHTSTTVHNPNYMIDNDQNEYAECTNPASPSNPAITTASREDALKHDYTELHTSVQSSKHDIVDVYNVVGEGDCTVTFRGNDEYHEYSLPEIGQDAPPQGPYQNILREGTYQEITTEYNVKKAVGIGLNQGPEDNKNPLTPSKLNENAYQDLCKKDDKDENSYQALKITEPEYLELLANDTPLGPEQLNPNVYENS